MSTETHINQFVREIEEKYQKAVATVGELKDAIEAFKNKAASMSPEIREAIGAGERALDEVEQKTKESNQKAPSGDTTSAKDTATDDDGSKS